MKKNILSTAVMMYLSFKTPPRENMFIIIQKEVTISQVLRRKSRNTRNILIRYTQTEEERKKGRIKQKKLIYTFINQSIKNLKYFKPTT